MLRNHVSKNNFDKEHFWSYNIDLKTCNKATIVKQCGISTKMAPGGKMRTQ